jgi:hypothetical protein
MTMRTTGIDLVTRVGKDSPPTSNSVRREASLQADYDGLLAPLESRKKLACFNL